jgi:hypothetical protein
VIPSVEPIVCDLHRHAFPFFRIYFCKARPRSQQYHVYLRCCIVGLEYGCLGARRRTMCVQRCFVSGIRVYQELGHQKDWEICRGG